MSNAREPGGRLPFHACTLTPSAWLEPLRKKLERLDPGDLEALPAMLRVGLRIPSNLIRLEELRPVWLSNDRVRLHRAWSPGHVGHQNHLPFLQRAHNVMAMHVPLFVMCVTIIRNSHSFWRGDFPERCPTTSSG